MNNQVNTNGSSTTYFRLLDYITKQAETTDRLPSEEALASMLGISRVKIRDLLGAMETNGLVIRKRGVGTLINRTVLAEKVRVDMDNIFTQSIEALGYEASVRVTSIRHLEDCDPYLLEKLQLPGDGKLYRVDKVISADSKPAIALSEYFPEAYFDENDLDLELIATNSFAFVQSRCNQLIDCLLSHIEPIITDKELSEIMQLPESTPILYIEDICYSQTMNPITISRGYYNTKIFPMSVFKRTIISREFYE